MLNKPEQSTATSPDPDPVIEPGWSYWMKRAAEAEAEANRLRAELRLLQDRIDHLAADQHTIGLYHQAG